MGFVEAVKKCLLENYVSFGGRARRAEYWWFFLFYLIVSIVASVIDSTVFGSNPEADPFGGPLGMLLTLALFLPSLGVWIRRLHDIDRSGWWALIVFIPIIGALVILYWAVKKGTVGDNRFGADPLGGTPAVAE